MPTWSQPPEAQLEGTLRQVWQDLNADVSENPSFDAIVGVSMEQLANHAGEAISQFLNRDETLQLHNPNIWVQVYALGFVVGTRYGEQRHASANPGS